MKKIWELLQTQELFLDQHVQIPPLQIIDPGEAAAKKF